MSRTGRTLRLSILSRRFVIASDRAGILRVLGFQYRRFVEKTGRGPAPRRIELRLAGPQPGVGVDGRWIPLAPGASAAALGTGWLFEALLDDIPGQLFFHAGVVSRHRRALLICGPPAFGKTSLVLALARRPGFRFLSDDFAPLSPTRGTVAPFPRSVGLVAGSALAQSFLDGVPRRGRLRFSDKWLVDPAAIPGLVFGRACRPAMVLLIGPPDPPGAHIPPRYEITLARRLSGELAVLLGGVRLSRRRVPGAPDRHTFRFSLSPRRGLAGALQAWMARNRDGIYSLVRVYPRRADFRPPARLRRIPASRGLIEMLADLQNRRPDPSGSTGRRSPGRLLLEAAGVLGAVPFYRLRGGTLTERVALVERVFSRTAEGEGR